MTPSVMGLTREFLTPAIPVTYAEPMRNHTEERRLWEDVREGSLVLKRGADGHVVRMLQERLIATGYDVPPSGTFCPQTEFSVMDLQKNHQLTRTGQVGSQTSALLDSIWENTWDQVRSGYNTLGLGDQCAAVSTLQKRLIQVGLPVEVSGVFGPSTRRRVIAFQQAHDQEPTGNVGAETSKSLDEAAKDAEEEREKPSTAAGINPTSLVRVKTSLVAPQVAEALDRMSRAARGDGVIIRILEGYRDPTRQQTAAREAGFIPTSACTGNPGENPHGTGFAVDLDDGRAYRWLRRNGRVFGFVMPHAGEPWHWIYNRK
jgi:peptidoglycan hydrolase-like protein with peptidoglycan-binding domain